MIQSAGAPAATPAHLPWRQRIRLPLLLLFGLNLRTVLLAVAPLLPLIQHELGLNYTATGLLSNLPIMLMGLLAFPASLVIARFGVWRAIIVALGLILSMAIWRGFVTDTLTLFLSTALLSVGVTLGQTTSPTLMRAWFPRHIGQTTAAYATGLMVGEIVAASVTAPWILPLVGGSWRAALLTWSIPVALALLAWIWLAPRPSTEQSPEYQASMTHDGEHQMEPTGTGPSGQALPWWQILVAALALGSSSVLFFGMSTWIPVYFHAMGRSDTSLALASLTIFQLPASLGLTFWGRRLVGTRLGFIVAGSVAAVTMALWFVAPASWDVALAGLIAAEEAPIFIFGLSLPALLARGASVARMSGIMLGVGYSLAFVVPSLGGILWDLTRVPLTAFFPIFLASLLAIICGAFLPRIQGT